MKMTIKGGKLRSITHTGGYKFVFSNANSNKKLKWENEKKYFALRTFPLCGETEYVLFQKVDGASITKSQKVKLGEAIPKWIPLTDGSYQCDDCY
jgi:hypothetical protein